MVTGDAFPWPGQRYSGIGIDRAAELGEEPNEVAEGVRLAVKRLAAHADHARNAETPSGPLPEDIARLASPWRRTRL